MAAARSPSFWPIERLSGLRGHHWLRPGTRGAPSALVACSLVLLCHTASQGAHFYIESGSHKKAQKYTDGAWLAESQDGEWELGSISAASWLHKEKTGRVGVGWDNPNPYWRPPSAPDLPTHGTEQAIAIYLVHLILGSLLFQGIPLLLRSVTAVTLFPYPTCMP